MNTQSTRSTQSSRSTRTTICATFLLGVIGALLYLGPTDAGAQVPALSEAKGTIPPDVIRQALTGTAIPLWLQEETPIQVLPDVNDGIVAFYYPYTRTIYLRASPYLQRGGKWDVARIAEVLSHEFGHRFQHLAAPNGSPAWQRFEDLTPGFTNGPRGVRAYQVWQMNREEAFAEAFRHLYGGIGAQSPPLVPLTVTPAIRAYFQELMASLGR